MKSIQRAGSAARENGEGCLETLRICMDRNILKEYLESRRKEVVTMMMDLYDQDRILEIHIESEKKIAAEEAAKKAAEKAAEKEKKTVIKRLLRDGTFSVDKIASIVGVPLQRVREIEAGML